MIFNDSLKFGLGGERIVAEIMRARGWTVVQVGGQHGEYKGPRIELPLGLELVSPDLIVIKNGIVRWIEVKRKTQFSYHRNSEAITTGIDLHHWNEYLQNDTYGSFPMWLFFVHEFSSVAGVPAGTITETPKAGVYLQSVSWLSKNSSHTSMKFGGHGGIFWDIKALKCISF